MCTASCMFVCVKYFIQLFFRQSFCLFLFHVHICVSVYMCAFFCCSRFAFQIEWKTHRHTQIQNWMTPIRIHSMGNERFSVRFFVLKKNSFMIYDLLSIMRKLGLRVSMCVQCSGLLHFSSATFRVFFVQFSRAIGHKIFNDR